MTEQELERALRQALPTLHPEPDLVDRICAQLESNAAWRAESGPDAGTTAASDAPFRSAGAYRRWLPAAMAAAVLLGVGLAHWTEQQHQRQLQARAQLLQGLTIASASLQDARSAVLQSEYFAP